MTVKEFSGSIIIDPLNSLYNTSVFPFLVLIASFVVGCHIYSACYIKLSSRKSPVTKNMMTKVADCTFL